MGNYYVKHISRPPAWYGPFSLRTAKDYARIGAKKGAADRAVFRGTGTGAKKIRVYSAEKRVWPVTKAQARGLTGYEMPRTLEDAPAKGRATMRKATKKKAAKGGARAGVTKKKTVRAKTRKAAPKRAAKKKPVARKTAPKRKARNTGAPKRKTTTKKKAASKSTARKKTASRGRKAPARRPSSRRATHARRQPARRPSSRRATHARRQPAPPAATHVARKGVSMPLYGYTPGHGKYVVADGSGRVLGGAKTLAAARKKMTALAEEHPGVATHIVKVD